MTTGLDERLLSALGTDSGLRGSPLPQAAVLVILDAREAGDHVILTQRAQHMRQHAGEIAFPGGKCDDTDKDHWATALRESAEEIALQSQHVTRLGVMLPVVTRTGIEVTPCVARLQSPVQFEPNPAELDAVFSVPLDFLAQSSQLQFDTFEYGGRQRRVPRYEWQQYSIWGITAAILVKLVNLGCNAGLEMEDYWQGR